MYSVQSSILFISKRIVESKNKCSVILTVLRKSTISVFLLYILFFFIWGACAPSSSTGSESIVISLAGTLESLDPARVTSSEAAQISAQIYEPLVRLSKSDQGVKPCLATHWTVSPDGTRWVFYLRRGVHFHDGKVFDADAVVFSYERQRDKNHTHYSSKFIYRQGMFDNIVKTKKLSRYKVEITTTQRFAPFLATASMFSMAIVDPDSVRENGELKKVNGTGPFRFISWVAKEKLVLEKNSTYWGGIPQVKRLVFSLEHQEAQRFNALQSGAVDVVFGIRPENQPIVGLHPELRLMRAGAPNVVYLAFNTLRAPFNNARVRRALNHAINKKLIIQLGYQGLARPAYGPIPPNMWTHASSIHRYDYLKEKAKQLLKDEGFPFTKRFTLYAMKTPRPYLPSPVQVAKIIARNLYDVGVRVELVFRTHEEHVAALRRGEHDLGLLGWTADNYDPDNFLYLLLDGNLAEGHGNQNISFFRNQTLHSLLEKARHEMLRGKRAELYQKAQHLIANEAPWVPICHADVVVAARKRLRHFKVGPANILDFLEVRF